MGMEFSFRVCVHTGPLIVGNEAERVVREDDQGSTIDFTQLYHTGHPREAFRASESRR